MEIGERVKMAAEDETAKKENPEIEGSLSLGRKADTNKGDGSVAIGVNCEASGVGSVSFGNYCRSTGKYTFSANNNCSAIRDRASAFGQASKASAVDQFVCGKYNVEETNGDNIFIVGNGSSSKRSNAFYVTKNGDGRFSGNVYDGEGNSMAIMAQYILDLQNAPKYGVRFKVKKLTQNQTFILKPNMIVLVQTSSSGQVVCNNAASPITFSDLAFIFCSGYENGDNDISEDHYRCIVTWKTASGVLASTDMKTCDHKKTATGYYIKNSDNVNMWVSYVERAE